MSSITRQDLVEIAKNFGKTERSVRWAVDSQLIPKGIPKGNGRASGQTWSYPPGTDQALEVLFQLQNLGMRGGSLDFTTWWRGYVPISPRAVKFIRKVVQDPKNLIMEAVERGSAESTEYNSMDSTLRESPRQEQMIEEVFGEELGEKLFKAPELREYLSPILDTLIPGATSSISNIDLENLLTVASTFLFGYTPQDYEGSPDQVFEMINELPRSRSTKPDASIEQIKEIGKTIKFDPVLAEIVKADSQRFNLIRDYIKSNTTLIGIAQETARAEEVRQEGMSIRKKSRQGPWKQPHIATLALIVGVGVGSVGLFNSLGLDGEKLMKIV